MIDWILNRLEEGLSNEYYEKGKKEESIESMFLCRDCDTVWSIGKEGSKKLTHYYYEVPKYGKSVKQCFYCKDK
jgi:hypothetical protein